VAVALLMGVAACEQDELLRPPGSTPVDVLFTHYVSVGNSITAGVQSGGINEVTQGQAYAVLLAQRMQTPFFIPAMNQPGCPSLYTNVFTQTRVPGPPCALRKADPYPSPYINNVAVPFAEIMDAVTNLDTASNANTLTTFFLGGLTQIQMLQRVRPTFATVWLGNNDVLAAITRGAQVGDSNVITPPTVFATRYTTVMSGIDAVGPLGGVLIGVVGVNGIPYLSQGQAYFAAKAAGALPPTFTVGANCNPRALGGNGDSVLVPFPFGGALLNQAAGGTPVTLTCTEPETVQPAELRKIAVTVTAYNQTIQAAAGARGWAYLDPNPTFDSLRLAGPTTIQPFPLFGQPCTANPFGSAISCDGIHPSAAIHRLTANKLIQAINATYGTSLAAIP